MTESIGDSTAVTSAVAQVAGNQDLPAILSALTDVTDRLKVSHDRLESEVVRLRRELAAKNRELERRKRLAALGEMAAGLAHEIRNPLGGISLFASVLRRDLPDRPKARDLVDKIQIGVQSLEKIVCDVLAFARPEGTDCHAAVLGQIVDGAVELAGPTLAEHGVNVVVDTAVADMDVWVDARQLQRALLNLLLNATQACGDGGMVWVLAKRDGDGSVEIEVADSGSGLSAEAMDRLFNPFFTTKKTGTGLGLAIVHRIVDEHGGTIHAANRREGGAVFRIRLPAAGQGVTGQA